MKIDIEEYLKEEDEREAEQQEAEAYDGEYWLYNPHEDAGDRV